MKFVHLILVLMLSPALLHAGEKIEEKVLEVEGRDDASIKFLYIKHPEPVAHVIFFPGGRGHIELSDGMFGASVGQKYQNAFSFSSRKMWSKEGISAAILETPSDRGPRMGNGFRESSDYRDDIAAVIDRMKQDADVPVWLIGHSRGTIGATAQTINLGNNKVNGLIISAGITAGKPVDTYIPDMQLENIQVPVLVMYAANDKCDEYTPISDAQVIADKLVNAPRVSVIYPEGARKGGHPCRSESAHSYLGIREKVISQVAEFIKANL